MNIIDKIADTPLYKLFVDENQNSVYIKRDDLIPFSFGGNKARIALEYIKDMYEKKKNCIIGYGSVTSNLVRVLACYCSKFQIPCYIISPSNDNEESFNEELSKVCGAMLYKCKKNEVAETIEKVFFICENQGYSPYYINGDKFGKGNEVTPVHAYYKAYDEILDFEKKNSVSFDYIFLPIGTGMTQAGVLCGVSNKMKKTKVFGISIARDSKNEKPILRKFLDSFTDRYNYDKIEDSCIHIIDSYLCGGYGKYNTDIENTISSCFTNYGIPLDVTYSGKAFYGMIKSIDEMNIKGKNVLFLHTGGTPLFFDYIAKKTSDEIVQIKDYNILVNFLNKVDADLPIPLSKRVNLNDYAKKLLENGNVFGIMKNNLLIAAVLFYSNNFETNIAYLSLLATIAEYRGRGYARKLLTFVIRYCQNKKMKIIDLDTDFSNKNAISLYTKMDFEIMNSDKKIHMRRFL